MTLSVTNLAFTSPTSHASLLVYLGADAGTFISSYTPAEVTQALHTYLSSRISSPHTPAESPIHSFVTDWLTDPFSRGATSSPVEKGGERSPLDFVILSRSAWGGRLGFAGEHTDLDHRGSVVGAVVSGEREGKRVAGLLQRLS